MPAVEKTDTRRARWAVGTVFAVHGAASGTWATRIPWVQQELGLGPGSLGVALAFATLGAALAMPLAARLTHRLGPRAALRLFAVVCCTGLVLPPLAPDPGWLCAGLLLFGAGLGLLDVVMNAHGVQVEERLGRSVMSGLHGLWSVGTLAGGALGALAAHAGVDARLHTACVAPVLVVVSLLASRRVLDLRADPAAEQPPHFALPGRKILAIGTVGFCAVFAEGASMDWSGVYLREVADASPGTAAAAYTAFACTMAVARLAGDAVVRRWGPVRTVRAGGLLATSGGLLVVSADSPAPAVAGFALVGLGIAVVVPLCFAAAGRTSTEPGQAIAGVATLAYASGLAAPALIGWIAEATSLPVSFALVTVLAAGLVTGAGLLRPGRAPRPETVGGPAAGDAPGRKDPGHRPR